MFRKLLALILAAMMMVSMAGFAMADDGSSSIQIEPVLLSLMEMSTTEWYKDYANRTMFATLAWMDVVLADNLDDSFEDAIGDAVLSGTVYVARSSQMLVAMYFDTDVTILVGYVPAIDAMYISKLNPCNYPEQVLSSMKADGDCDSYYQIDKADILEVVEVVLDAITQ